MQLNALHMRFGAIAGGIVLMAAYAFCGGAWGDETIVQIDFSMDPDLFEGMQVEIDGKVVGRLQSTGNAARSGYEVSRGAHDVRVLDPKYGSATLHVDLDQPGQKARLMLDIVEMVDEDTGTTRPTLQLMR